MFHVLFLIIIKNNKPLGRVCICLLRWLIECFDNNLFILFLLGFILIFWHTCPPPLSDMRSIFLFLLLILIFLFIDKSSIEITKPLLSKLKCSQIILK